MRTFHSEENDSVSRQKPQQSSQTFPFSHGRSSMDVKNHIKWVPRRGTSPPVTTDTNENKTTPPTKKKDV